jgi:hypothetical protein
VKTVNTLNFSQDLTPYTSAAKEIAYLLKSHIPNRSVEYMDNRIRRYSMKMGTCEITGMYVFANTSGVEQGKAGDHIKRIPIAHLCGLKKVIFLQPRNTH